MLSLTLAVALGMATVLLDLGARSYRLRLLLRAVGGELPRVGAYVATAFGDAASVLTPLRLGGTPARLVVMRSYQVPVPAALRALALDLATYQVVLVAAGVILAVGAVPAFWPGPQGWSDMGDGLRLGVALSAGGLATAGVVCRNRLRSATHRAAELFRRCRGDPSFGRGLLVSLGLAAISIGARLSLLPLLALSLPPGARPAELTALAFVVTFGQVVVPTPSGAGAVEVAFAASDLSGIPGGGSIFIAWRVLTVGLVAVLGIGIVLPICGRQAILATIRSGRGPTRDADGQGNAPPPAP